MLTPIDKQWWYNYFDCYIIELIILLPLNLIDYSYKFGLLLLVLFKTSKYKGACSNILDHVTTTKTCNKCISPQIHLKLLF